MTNTNGSGAGSLRQAIEDASDGDVIGFAPGLAGATILLGGELLVEGKSLTISGPATGITLHGGGVGRVLHLRSNGGTPGALVLRNVTITGGVETGGAGIYVGGRSELTLEHSTVTGNRAEGQPTSSLGPAGGGGIAVSFGRVTLVNSTVSGNSTSWFGGGIQVHLQGTAGFADAVITLIHSTVADNTAEFGGGFEILPSAGSDNDVVLILHNSIVAANTSTDPGSNNCRRGAATVVVLLGINYSDDTSCADAGAGLGVMNLGLLPLASNGGPTKTHALHASSPAIDAAPDCPVAVDQRYVARPQAARCDAGAYEFNDYITTALVLDGSGTVNPNTGVTVITGTMTCSAPIVVELQVELTQQQKTKRVNSIVEAADAGQVVCSGRKAWSIALTPATGAFQNGAAAVTARTVVSTPGALPSAAASTVKLVWGRK